MPKRRRAVGGPAYLALLHPGPSAVCTAITAAAGWSAARRRGGGGGWVRHLALAGAAMALAQVSTGVLNDAFDAPWDRRFQPYKPIAAGSVPRWHAWVIGIGCGFLSLLAAAAAGGRCLGLMRLGLASGWSYSLGLSRTPLSPLPFITGLATVPLLGAASVGEDLADQRQVAVLAAALGVGLHLANGGPDSERDRLAGRRSLPVLLGPSGSIWLSQGLLALGALLVGVRPPPQGRAWCRSGAGLCLGLLLLDRRPTRRDRGLGDRPFVLPALAGGALAGGWLLGRSTRPASEPGRVAYA